MRPRGSSNKRRREQPAAQQQRRQQQGQQHQHHHLQQQQPALAHTPGSCVRALVFALLLTSAPGRACEVGPMAQAVYDGIWLGYETDEQRKDALRRVLAALRTNPELREELWSGAMHPYEVATLSRRHLSTTAEQAAMAAQYVALTNDKVIAQEVCQKMFQKSTV